MKKGGRGLIGKMEAGEEDRERYSGFGDVFQRMIFLLFYRHFDWPDPESRVHQQTSILHHPIAQSGKSSRVKYHIFFAYVCVLSYEH